MKTKLIPILFIFLLVIVMIGGSVSASDKTDCNNNGQIWCGTVSAGYCLPSVKYSPLKDCVVNISQEIEIPINTTFYAHNFNVSSGVTLQLYQKNPQVQSCIFGGRGGDECVDCGEGGGNGGSGGCQFKLGTNGGVSSHTGDPDKLSSARRVGAILNLTLTGDLKIESRGKLSISGESATKAKNGTKRRCSGEASTGGNGGASGGSGGKIIVRAHNIYGKIFAVGGDGGDGGDTINPGTRKLSGSGGGGVAGAGGYIEVYAKNVENFCSPNFIASGKNGNPGTPANPDASSCSNVDPYGKAPSSKPPDGFCYSHVLSENCNNGIDDDNDNYIDMEDNDCFNIQAKKNSWQVNGPIFFSSYENVVGVNKTDVGISWWNPLAKDGSDGVCGDDSKTGCYPKVDCTINNCNENFCNATKTFVSCTGPTIGCSKYEDEHGSCLSDAPSFCEDQRSDSYSYYSTNPYECVGAKSCMDMSRNDCEIVSDCTPQYVIKSCEPIVDCESQKNVDDCNSTYCEWRNTSDKVFVTPDDKRYFCNNDYYNKSDGNKIIVVPSSTNSQWYWWDAFAQSGSFKTHISGNEDFISNGESWFVCNATGNVVNQNAISIEKDSTFNTATKNGEYLCSTILNTLKPFFDKCKENQKFFGNDPEWTGFSDKLSNDSNYYYCQTVDGKPASQKISGYFNDAIQGCLNYCGHGNPVDENDFEPLKNLNSQNNELLKDACGSDASTNFHTEFCKTYPCNNNGLSSVDFKGKKDENKGTFLDVDSCGYNMKSCLGTSTSGYDKCTNINYFEYDLTHKGYLCEQEYGDYNKHYYCASGKNVYSADLFSVDKDGKPVEPIYGSTCCVDVSGKGGKNVCKPIPEGKITQDTCEELGGDYLPTTENIKDYYCDPFGDVDDNGNGRCCFGNGWKNVFKNDYNYDLAQNSSFICYEEAGKSRIAECCTDFAPCNNKETIGLKSFFGSANDYLHGYYGKGGVLHTLRNFNNFGDTYKNYFYRFTPQKQSEFSLSKNSILDSANILGFKERGLYNWTSFDNLEFDIAYNILAISKNKFANNLKIHLVDENDESCNFSVTNYSTNGYMPLRWHHIVLPLNQCAITFNFSNVRKIFFSVKDNNDVRLGVDNFYLSENTSKDNSDNYYCTGNFASWIKNLDGKTPKGFDINATLKDYGPYMYACQAQASYDWTGRRCCGDQTKNPNYWTSNKGEYFNDTLSGCFHGTTIYQNTRVGDVLNDPRLNNLLFYNGAFLGCINGSVNGVSKKESFDAVSNTGNDLVTANLPSFTVRGKFICDQSGNWINKESYSVSRIMASKMYNLSSDKNKFTIYCESPDNATNLDLKNNLSETYPFIKDMCTLQYYDSSNKAHTLVGIGFKDISINGFLNSIKNHLNSFYFGSNKISETNLLSFPSACDNIQPGSTNNDKFFSSCNTKIKNLGILYNPDFNILFIAQDLSKPLDEFDGIFKDLATTRDYIQHYWNSFISIFKKWFGFGDASGEKVIWTNETVLPLFSNASSQYTEHLEGYLKGTPISGKVVDMKKLFIKKNGAKRIDAFKESLPAYKGGSDFITIEYIGFNKSVKYLAEQYFSNDEFELQYARSGTETQIIQIVNPKKHGDNLEGEEKTFEPDFTWQRIGPLIYFSDEALNPTLGAAKHNGVVDLGEWCDDDSQGNTFYKFRNNTCKFWNLGSSGNVSCNLADNTLDNSTCE